MKKFVVVVTVSALSLSACVEGSGQTPIPSGPSKSLSSSVSVSKGLTAEEAALRKQKDTFNTTIVEGAVVGALAGAIFGQLVGGDTESTLVGAAAGGALGAASGFYVANRQAEYTAAENQLDGAIAAARADNRDLARTVQLSNTTIANDRARLAKLRSDYKGGTVSKSQYNAELKKVKTNRDTVADISQDVSKRIVKRREDVSYASSTYGSAAAAPLASEVNTFGKQKAALDRTFSQYDVLLSSYRLDS